MACMGQLSKSQVADSVAAHLVIKTALKTWNYKMSDSTAFEYAATPGDSDVMWARLIEAAGAAEDKIEQQNQFLGLAKQMIDIDIKTGLMDTELS